MFNNCRFCHSTNVSSVRCATGPHHARAICLDCDRTLGWVPAPMTDERARAFVMPFGKYKGTTIGEILDQPDGERYLRWLHGQSPEGPLGRALGHIFGRRDHDAA
jgi:uncharacterized protein (DUF3820 family)